MQPSMLAAFPNSDPRGQSYGLQGWPDNSKLYLTVFFFGTELHTRYRPSFLSVQRRRYETALSTNMDSRASSIQRECWHTIISSN